MAGYEARILKGILDSYERSLLSQGKNKVAVHIAFPFTRKNLRNTLTKVPWPMKKSIAV